MATPTAALRRNKALQQMASGLLISSIPVGTWWYWARQQRAEKLKAVASQIRIPNVDDTYDYLIAEKCQAGDVVVFDRRVEHCASSPWAALACAVARALLISKSESQHMDHVGLIVPGYSKTRAEALNPTNLLLIEATASGIVARPLKERLECSFSRSILLVPLACPGERRFTDDDPTPIVERTRNHVEKELRQFRDMWLAVGEKQGYSWMHSTLTLGGAILYGLRLQDYSSGPVSPSSFLVLLGLHKAAAAANINDKENRRIKPTDYLRDSRMQETEVVRLRPGWRFLKPIPLKENAR